VATEVFAFEPDRLLGTLEKLVAGDGELKDFGQGLLPALVDEEAQIPGGTSVAPGGRFSGEG
jgi:hypothetical protein